MSPAPGRTPRALTACLAAVVAAGCSASPPAPPARTPAPPSASARPSTSSATPVQVVGLGDSVVEAATCGCDGPVEAYAGLLAPARHRPARADNLGISGETAHALADALADDDQTRRAVAAADVVVVVVGANDVAPLAGDWEHCPASCWHDTLGRLDTDLDTTLGRIAAQRHDPSVPVLVATYWNVLQDGATALARYGEPRQAWTLQLTAATNDVITRQTSRHGDVVVDLDPVFHGSDGHADPTGLLLDDADHPNAAGVQAIARALLAATPATAP